jgi:hydrogenase maturation protease
MRTLVLGLGNPILRDDSVGLRVVRQVAAAIGEVDGLDVDEDYHGGLRLMERMVGYDRAVIVDAIQSGAPPGSLIRLEVDGRPTQHSASTHDVNLPTALALGRQAGAHLPHVDRIAIIAVEALDVLTFGESLTPQVEDAIPLAAQAVLQELGLEKESA